MGRGAKQGQLDLAIVGAGAAGIGAARAAQGLGLSCVVLEARSRIGGRADTDVATFGVPWDRGCHWLHSATVNPFRALADSYGFRYRRPEERGIRIVRESCWSSDADNQAALAAIDQAFVAVVETGPTTRDDAAAAVDTLSHATNRWGRLIDASMAEEIGVDPACASRRDWARYQDTDENWPVEAGYGALVARHAAGVPVTLNSPVERISWRTDGVRLLTPVGAVEADAAILTCSVGVLADERIRFDPPLPDWKRDAIGGLNPGRANKVALGFAGDALADAGAAENSYILSDGDPPLFVYLRPFGRSLAICSVAGSAAESLEAAGPAAMEEAARKRLRAMFGGATTTRITTVASTAWGSDPYIRAAYSSARPGQADARLSYAQPVADRLFFAGEATSIEAFGTAHGALQSGIAAVEAVAKVRRTIGIPDN